LPLSAECKHAKNPGLNKWLKILIVSSLIPLAGLHAQTLPPIQIFKPEDYNADNQNWQISQSDNKFIYVANNRGLLEYNGSTWRLYPSPNNTVLRSVTVIGDRVYTGCYMEFGYWVRNSTGKLEYVSLTPLLVEKMRDDDQVWSILELNEWVIFQSAGNIYFYNSTTGKFRIIDSKASIYRAFKVNNDIYYDVRGQGIYKMENGESSLFLDDPAIRDKRIVNIFEADRHLILLTIEEGFFRVEGNKVVKWDIPANKTIVEASIFCGVQLADGSFVIGTISNGIILINSNGEIAYRLNQSNGLSNNTALSLFEDIDDNLWIGLDNGVNCVNITSPIKFFNDYEGQLGTVYTSKVFGNNLYLGTNQGLFYKEVNSKEPFKFIENTSGQVWDLFNYKNEALFCGHHLGTFEIKGDKAILIDNNPGTWTFREVPSRENLLLKGNYNGLYLLEKKDGRWDVRNKIVGFNASSRFFELGHNNQIWINHEYKGVYKLKVDDSLTKVLNLTMEPFSHDAKNSSLVKFNGEMLYAYEQGIYRYDDKSSSFIYDSLLSPIIKNEDYITGKMVVDGNEKLWAFSKDNIYYATTDHLTNEPRIHSVPIPLNLRKVTQSFENISRISDDTYLLGTANGYLTIDISGVKNDAAHKIHLNSVVLKDIDNNTVDQDITEPGEFRHKAGIITFSYSVPEYNKYLDVKYQYKLEGQSTKWSGWSTAASSQFENLGFGDYVFSARAKIGNILSENFITYRFKVNRPWYLSTIALLVYLLTMLSAGYFINRAYDRHFYKKLINEQLKNDKLIVELRNEQLNRDIESKNRELAISKMNILRNNELLNEIKKEIKKDDCRDSTLSVSRLIEKNLSNTKDWEIFVRAFNETDKGFLDKLKSLHPNLTPNDLKFCVYLRLNMSSKEIAPLLNISVKSVETRRYRLRKRMNLPHEGSLVNYILDL
jgi:DNA-binding CsgD family transcriptional regulator